MRDLHLPGRSAVQSLNGMAATSHPLASLTAIETLKAGGNAADAAIAAAMVLTITEPQMCSLGGDCFVLLKPAGDDRVIAINGSGRAPAGFDAEKIRAEGHDRMPIHGIHAVTMPGAVDAMCRLNADWGLLPLDRLMAPGIAHAEAGVPVGPRTAFDWAMDVADLRGDALRFYSDDGKAPKPGQIFRAPGLAEVMRRIGAEGRKGFYEGEVAEDMISSLTALGGAHAMQDLADTRCDQGEPISGFYNDTELLEHPPNSQGATAILLLNILKHFDLAKLDPFGAERAHIEAEAAKLAYDARNRFLAERTPRLEHMLSPRTAEKLAALIDPTRAMANPAALTEAVHKDTTYITVVDRDRMAVSLIYSAFWGFGSGLASAKFGVNFQNRGAGFTLEKGHPNEAGPGKRPMHTIIPAMLRQGGQVSASFGVMGGSYQPAGHARFVSNLTDFGMDLQEAIDAPRSFCAPGEGMQVERGYSEAVRARLAELGHSVTIPDVPLGGAQAIVIGRDGVLTGGSDPRKDGCALGY